MLSPLQLIRSRYGLIYVQPNFEHDEEQDDPLSIQIETTIFIDEEVKDELVTEPLIGLVSLSVRNKNSIQNYPLIFDISLQGEFTLAPKKDGIPFDDAQRMMKINGASVLYGQIREFFTMISSRTCDRVLPLPTLYPSLAFHKVEETEIENKDKKIKAEKKP